MTVTADVRAAVADAIYASALALDANDFPAFFALVAPELRYRIEAYSPELRRSMTWLEHDRAGLAALVELLPRHHLDGAQWTRHVVVYRVSAVGAERVEAVSSALIHHTVVDVGDPHVDGGSSRLFAVGRYHDELRRGDDGRWLLSARTVKLQTRQLGIGNHLFP